MEHSGVICAVSAPATTTGVSKLAKAKAPSICSAHDSVNAVGLLNELRASANEGLHELPTTGCCPKANGVEQQTDRSLDGTSAPPLQPPASPQRYFASQRSFTIKPTSPHKTRPVSCDIATLAVNGHGSSHKQSLVRRLIPGGKSGLGGASRNQDSKSIDDASIIRKSLGQVTDFSNFGISLDVEHPSVKSHSALHLTSSDACVNRVAAYAAAHQPRSLEENKTRSPSSYLRLKIQPGGSPPQTHEKDHRHSSRLGRGFSERSSSSKSRNGSAAVSRTSAEHKRPPPPYQAAHRHHPPASNDQGRMAVPTRKDSNMHRSSSNLDLQRTSPDRRPSQPVFETMAGAPIASFREYGSTSSIDVIAKEKTEFEQVIHNLKNTGVSGDFGPDGSPNFTITPRGPLTVRLPSSRKAAASELCETSQKSKGSSGSKDKSKTSRSKSVANESIFKKLRNRTAEADSVHGGSKLESVPSVDFREEERLRRKIFAHYDCQSITAHVGPLLCPGGCIAGFSGVSNSMTGASAASYASRSLLSPQGSEEADSPPESTATFDHGDGKSNDSLLSCPYFRNEIGVERYRQIALVRGETCPPSSGLASSPSQARGAQNGAKIGTPAPTSFAASLETWHGVPSASETSVLENLSRVYLGGRLCAKRQPQLVIEHSDQGAFYYRHCFSGKAHQNYFGVDETLGPVAISVMRERLDPSELVKGVITSSNAYRLIVRLSDLSTFRGAILEEALSSYQASHGHGDSPVPAGTHASAGSGPGTPAASLPGGQSTDSPSSKLPVRELLDLVVPELQPGCLRLAVPVPRTEQKLLELDEHGVNTRYKVGILFCKAGQCTEEQMYNNEHSTPSFDEFLDILGQRERLKSFDKYRGGLDIKGDTTGLYSLYTTFQQFEIMFHVSTMLPFTPNNKQQLSRKRHIGNDIVTVIFQEPGALPFSPQTVRSHFQHVFIIVKAHCPNTDNVRYSISVSRSKDVPSFGPAIPNGAIFPKSKEFRDFLLTKIVNAENAVHKSEKFVAMAARTRRENMRDLAENHVTGHSLTDSSASSRITSKLLGGKKKDRPRPKLILASCVRAAIVWEVQAEDFSISQPVDALLGISADNLVIIEQKSRDVLFATCNLSIIGWTSHGNSVKLYYDHGDVIIFRTPEDEESEMNEILERLRNDTKGCETQEMILRRNASGQLGFHIQHEGIVSDVEMYGYAWQAGLRQGSRLVEICKVSVAALTQERLVELLKTSMTVRVLVIPPLEDGSPRRGCEDPYCSAVLTTDSPFFESVPDHSPRRGGYVRYPPPPQRPPPPRFNKTMDTTDVRSNSADQGFFSANPSDGANEYQSNTMSSMSSEDNHQLYKLPVCRRHSNDQTDTLSSVGSSASSDLSSDSGVRAQGSFSHSKRLRPSDLKKRVDKCKSDMTERVNSDRRIPTVDPTSYSVPQSQEETTPPAVPPRPYQPSPTAPQFHPTNVPPVIYQEADISAQFGPPPCRYYLYPDPSSMYRTYSDDSLHVSRSIATYVPPAAELMLATARPAHVDPRRLPLNRYTYLSPETERGIDWSNLVDAATKAIEGIQQQSSDQPVPPNAVHSHGGPGTVLASGSHQLKLEAAYHRIKLLEEKVDRLQDQLHKERDEKTRLELELMNMRGENSRLDEECRTAKNELQKFSEWFCKAVSNKSIPSIEPPFSLPFFSRSRDKK